jgi:hypothetical protein
VGGWGAVDDVIESWAAEAALPANLHGLWDDNLRKELSKRIARTIRADDWADLGWRGDVRQVKVHGPVTDRVAAAICERAAELGISVVVEDPMVTIETATPREHAAADKLIAYIDGLHDALTDSYGNPPVQVGRKDLERLLGAGNGLTFFDPGMTAVLDRIRQALREPTASSGG